MCLFRLLQKKRVQIENKIRDLKLKVLSKNFTVSLLLACSRQVGQVLHVGIAGGGGVLAVGPGETVDLGRLKGEALGSPAHWILLGYLPALITHGLAMRVQSLGLLGYSFVWG